MEEKIEKICKVCKKTFVTDNDEYTICWSCNSDFHNLRSALRDSFVELCIKYDKVKYIPEDFMTKSLRERLTCYEGK